jgi:hypothetical protein
LSSLALVFCGVVQFSNFGQIFQILMIFDDFSERLLQGYTVFGNWFSIQESHKPFLKQLKAAFGRSVSDPLPIQLSVQGASPSPLSLE